MHQGQRKLTVFPMSSIADEFDFILSQLFDQPNRFTPVQNQEQYQKAIEQAKQKAKNKYPNVPLKHVINVDGSHDIKIAVSGFNEDEISIEVENEKLYVKAEYANPKKESPELEYIFHDTLITKPFDMMIICEGLDLEKLSAGIKNGILSIVIPKKEVDPSEQTRKKIKLT